MDTDSPEDTHIVHRTLDTEMDDPTVQIAKIVAELTGKDHTDLATLYGEIDHLVAHLFGEPPASDAQAMVQFQYEGYQITVHQSGDATFLKQT